MMKSVPLPSSLLIVTSPPSACIISRQMLRPRPTPDGFAFWVSLSLLKFMKSFYWFSGEIPHPVSLKIISNLMSFSCLDTGAAARLAITDICMLLLLHLLLLLISLPVACIFSKPLADLFELLMSDRSTISMIFSIVVTEPPFDVNLIPFERKFVMT